MDVTALAETFDVSTVITSIADGATSALSSAVTGLTPVLVGVIAVSLAVRLFRKFIA